MPYPARTPFQVAALRVARLLSRAFHAAPVLHRLADCWAIVVLTSCTASVVHNLPRYPIDTLQFSRAGRVLWSSDWLDTFSDSWIQSGAAQLTLYGWTSRAEQSLELPVNLVPSLTIHLAVGFGVVGLVALPHSLVGRRTPSPLLLFAALAGWLLGIPSELYLFGHPAQFAITALWVLAAAAALRDRPAISGVLIALAAAWEPWGVLGAPLLLVLPGWRRRLTAVAWIGLASALAWGPFVVFGDFAMHEYRWRVRPTSLLAPLLGVDAAFPWQLRLLQGGVALACGVAVAHGLRRSSHVVWAVPLATVAARLIFDPMVSSYYWSPVKVLSLVAVASFLVLRDGRGFAVVPLLYPVLLIGLVPHWAAGVSALIGVALLVRTSTVAGDSRPTDAADAPAPGPASAVASAGSRVPVRNSRVRARVPNL